MCIGLYKNSLLVTFDCDLEVGLQYKVESYFLFENEH